MATLNEKIIDGLTILCENESTDGNKFKANAYKKVIRNIKSAGTLQTLDDVKAISGVGKKILDKIKELIETGKIGAVEEIRNDVDEKLALKNKLANIYGVGAVKIKQLMEKVKSFDDLYLEENKGLLNAKQQIGLKHYNDLVERIPYAEGKKHDAVFKKMLKSISPDIEYEMVGSYRRKSKTMGDIDILIKEHTKLSLNSLVKMMTESGYFIEKLASGKNKFMGICRLSDKATARRIDILVADKDTYSFAKLYFTGSFNFNIHLRNIALSKNLSLSEYGFKDNTTKELIKTSIQTERDIFDYLGEQYVEPEKR